MKINVIDLTDSAKDIAKRLVRLDDEIALEKKYEPLRFIVPSENLDPQAPGFACGRKRDTDEPQFQTAAERRLRTHAIKSVELVNILEAIVAAQPNTGVHLNLHLNPFERIRMYIFIIYAQLQSLCSRTRRC